MTDVLEKAIAELNMLHTDLTHSHHPLTVNAWAGRVVAAIDALRAEVERQKAAKPGDAAERLAKKIEAELITFIRAESGRDALAAELAKTDAVVRAEIAGIKTRLDDIESKIDWRKS